MKQEWRDKEEMIMENSFGTIPGSESTTTMVTIMTINEERRRGSFEWYDANTAGERYYCEGGLWFNDEGHMSDYDGNFSLPPRVHQFLYDEKMLDDSDIIYGANSKRITVTEEDKIRLKIGEEE